MNNLKGNYARLMGVLNPMLGLALILASLMLIRDGILAAYKKPLIHAAPARSDTSAPKRELRDYAVIVRDNPFGAQGGELKSLSAPKDASPSANDIAGLKLIGTVAGPRSRSYAIFTDTTGRQEVVKSGGPVYAYGTLRHVERNKVYIKTGGRIAEVPLADAVDLAEPALPTDTAPAPFVRSAGAGAYVIDQQRVRQALEQPGRIMSDARLLPYTVGNRQGFVLSEVRQGGIYQSLGLQNGDVLLRINDYHISDPERALQALNALKGMDSVQLDIVRNGSAMTMTYLMR